MPVVWRVVAVARVLGDVVGADDALAAEGGRKYVGVAGHRKLGKCFPRGSGERVEGVGFAFLIHHVVEERPELRPDQLGRGIRERLDELLLVKLRDQRLPDAVDGGDGGRLLPQRLAVVLLLDQLVPNSDTGAAGPGAPSGRR